MPNEESTFVGKVHYEVHPGPPEFTSIERGDKPEKKLIMLFEKPVCFAPDGEIGFEYVVTSRVHLVNSSREQFESERYYIIKGEPFHSHTAHHKAPVLIHVFSNVKPYKQVVKGTQ